MAIISIGTSLLLITSLLGTSPAPASQTSSIPIPRGISSIQRMAIIDSDSNDLNGYLREILSNLKTWNEKANQGLSDNDSAILSEEILTTTTTLSSKIRELQKRDSSIPTFVITDPVSGSQIKIGDATSSNLTVLTDSDSEELARESGISSSSDDSTTAQSSTLENNEVISSAQADKVRVPYKLVASDDSSTKGSQEKALLKEGIILVSLETEWDPGDEVDVIASAPPEPEPVAEETVTTPDSNTSSGNTAESSNSNTSSGNSGSSTPSIGTLPAAKSSIVETALQYEGYPYYWGAAGPYAFDCSGLTSYVYAQHGISLPRTAAAQGAGGTYVPFGSQQPGDLVAWTDGGHVAIYIGNGQIIHASTPSTGVKIASLYGDYYFVRY